MTTTTPFTTEATQTAVDTLVRPEDLAIGETTTAAAFADIGEDSLSFRPGYAAVEAFREPALIALITGQNDPRVAFSNAPRGLGEAIHAQNITVDKVEALFVAYSGEDLGENWSTVKAAFVGTKPEGANPDVTQYDQLIYTRVL